MSCCKSIVSTEKAKITSPSEVIVCYEYEGTKWFSACRMFCMMLDVDHPPFRNGSIFTQRVLSVLTNRWYCSSCCFPQTACFSFCSKNTSKCLCMVKPLTLPHWQSHECWWEQFSLQKLNTSRDLPPPAAQLRSACKQSLCLLLNKEDGWLGAFWCQDQLCTVS